MSFSGSNATVNQGTAGILRQFIYVTLDFQNLHDSPLNVWHAGWALSLGSNFEVVTWKAGIPYECAQFKVLLLATSNAAPATNMPERTQIVLQKLLNYTCVCVFVCV